jgi:hypothetical protein
VIKKLLGVFGLVTATMLLASGLVTPAAADARPPVPSTQAAPAGILDPWVSPNPEKSEFGKWTQQQATDWVNNCPPGRFCNWIRKGEWYTMFQFYKCGVYSLSGWTGISNYFNNQNVRVQILGSRHEVKTWFNPGEKFITNWNPIWYINMCA